MKKYVSLSVLSVGLLALTSCNLLIRPLNEEELQQMKDDFKVLEQNSTTDNFVVKEFLKEHPKFSASFRFYEKRPENETNYFESEKKGYLTVDFENYMIKYEANNNDPNENDTTCYIENNDIVVKYERILNGQVSSYTMEHEYNSNQEAKKAFKGIYTGEFVDDHIYEYLNIHLGEILGNMRLQPEHFLSLLNETNKHMDKYNIEYLKKGHLSGAKVKYHYEDNLNDYHSLMDQEYESYFDGIFLLDYNSKENNDNNGRKFIYEREFEISYL